MRFQPLWLPLLALAACDATPVDSEPLDTAVDISDTGSDTASDTGSDTASDTGSDTASDTGSDTASDTGSDTASDTGSDTASDTGSTAAWLVPDFGLIDVNTASLTSGQVVSPRDYLQQVSGWYFTHAT